MDKKLKELLTNEDAARSLLEFAEGHEEHEKARQKLEAARAVTEAYIIYKKKEHAFERLIMGVKYGD